MTRSAVSLPVPVDSFVGREAELTVGLRLITETRLLSLVGPGGAGKTRLVLRLADQVLDRYGVSAKRCWLVDLSAAESAGDAPAQLVAAAVGASIGTDADPVAAATEQIGDEPALLVVDNCEQVAEAVAQLVRPLLGSCPGLRVLATSQQPLNVPGEVVFPVEGLPVPHSDTPEWENAAAVQLFADRAREVDHRFVVAPELAEICARLDGLPLSIELAAPVGAGLEPGGDPGRAGQRPVRVAGSGRWPVPARQPVGRHRAQLPAARRHRAGLGPAPVGAARAVRRGYGDGGRGRQRRVDQGTGAAVCWPNWSAGPC
jgi:hypothetical protein